MDGTDPQTPDLIEEARAELAELEQRLTVLRSLLDRAAEPEGGGAPEDEPGAEGRFGRNQGSRASVARSVASHMSLDGYTRADAEERLRGTVSRQELQQILDEVYGRRSAAVR